MQLKLMGVNRAMHRTAVWFSTEHRIYISTAHRLITLRILTFNPTTSHYLDGASGSGGAAFDTTATLFEINQIDRLHHFHAHKQRAYNKCLAMYCTVITLTR